MNKWENIIFELNTVETFIQKNRLEYDYKPIINDYFLNIIDQVIIYFHEKVLHTLEGKYLILLLFKVEYMWDTFEQFEMSRHDFEIENLKYKIISYFIFDIFLHYLLV